MVCLGLHRCLPVPGAEVSALTYRNDHKLPGVQQGYARQSLAVIGRVGRIRTGCTCWRRCKEFAIPAKLCSTGRIIRLGRCSEFRFGTEKVVCSIAVIENEWVWAATRVQRQSHGPEQSPVRGTSFLASVLVCSPIAPPPPLLHYRPPHSISSRFPATFLPIFLFMEWRPVASLRKRCSGRN